MDKLAIKSIISEYNPIEDYLILRTKSGAEYALTFGDDVIRVNGITVKYKYINVYDLADDMVVLTDDSAKCFIPCSEIESIIHGGLCD